MNVVSVFGPFASRALVEMSVDQAANLFGDTLLGDCAPHNVVDAVSRDVAALPESLAQSALVAVALALAREIEHPYNSATSKSMCAARLTEIMGELRALCPPKAKVDRIDEVNQKREARRRRSADA